MSVAMRKPGARKRGSQVGVLVDPFRRIRIRFESRLERQAILVLVAHPRVRRVMEQQTVEWVDADGEVREKTFDLVVEWDDGMGVAYEVKYSSDVDRKRFDLHMAEVVGGLLKPLAHDYRILTERDLSELAIANAGLVVACGCDLDVAADEAVRAVLPAPGTRTTLGEIAMASGLGERGYRAAVAVLQSGLVSLDRGAAVSPSAAVTVEAQP